MIVENNLNGSTIFVEIQARNSLPNGLFILCSIFEELMCLSIFKIEMILIICVEFKTSFMAKIQNETNVAMYIVKYVKMLVYPYFSHKFLSFVNPFRDFHLLFGGKSLLIFILLKQLEWFRSGFFIFSSLWCVRFLERLLALREYMFTKVLVPDNKISLEFRRDRW